MRDKARQRMADLRKLRGNRRAALAYQRKFGIADGSKGKITNMREVLEAMAKWTPNRPKARKKAKSFHAIMRNKARQRRADLREARKSRRAAWAVQRRNAAVDGSKGTLTNLREVLEAMAEWTPQTRRRRKNKWKSLKPKSFTAIKREEARQRMTDLKKASKNCRAALLIQKRNSLTGDASKWRMINLPQVLHAMGEAPAVKPLKRLGARRRCAHPAKAGC